MSTTSGPRVPDRIGNSSGGLPSPRSRVALRLCSMSFPTVFRYLDLPRRLFAKLLNRLQQPQYRLQTCLSFIFFLLHYHMPQVVIREIQQCFELPDTRFVECGVMLIHEALQHDIQFQQSAPAPPACALTFFHCFRWFFWSSWS